MKTLDNIILNGRPGGGKSELIDFIKKTKLEQRKEAFRIGEFIEIDDFVWLWDKFVEDDIWESMGEKRIYSKRVEGGYVQLEGDRLLDMLAGKFDYVVKRDYLSKPDFYDDNTVFIEFARGSADGGFMAAYQMLSEELLKKSAIFYIKVTYEESCRKNEARYQEALKHSILAHRLPEESVIRFSSENDWEEISGGKESGYMEIKGVKVPFVAMNNEPELSDEDALMKRYSDAMQTLYKLYEER